MTAGEGTTVRQKVPRMRSALYVPGHRLDFMAKVYRTGADAVILDLEDAVPAVRRAEARATIEQWMAEPQSSRQIICVRINAPEQSCLDEDLAACVSKALTAVQVPKVQTPADVLCVDRALARQEQNAGLEEGVIRIWPLLETPLGVRNAFEIAACSGRVAYMGGVASPNGDMARAMGYRETGTFLETLYIRSKVLLDARAAGVPNPVSGMTPRIGDAAELERYANFVRSLGYEGMMAIHPSQVVVANAVFAPGADELGGARRLVEAFEAAGKEGQGATVHDGGMIDIAHYQTAQDLIARAEEFERRDKLAGD